MSPAAKSFRPPAASAAGDGRTRIYFNETYETFNPWMRRLGLERWVHHRLSRDNDTILAALEGGVRWHRRRKETTR